MLTKSQFFYQHIRNFNCTGSCKIFSNFSQRRFFRLVDPRPSETARLAAARNGANLVDPTSPKSEQKKNAEPDAFDVEAFQKKVLDRTMQQIESSIAKVRATDHLVDLVNFYSSTRPAKVNLNDIVVWLDNPRYDPYIHCHRQLPLLLAQLIRGISRMPEGLSSMPSIVATRKILVESFAQLTSLPVPINIETEQRFVDTLRELTERHAEHDILLKMATGVVELKRHHNTHREALRKLRTQHLAMQKIPLNDPKQKQDPLHPVHKRNQGKSETDFAKDLLRLQEPLDRFNRFFVEFNFTSRQLLEFAERIADTPGNEPDKLKPTDNCLTVNRPHHKMSQLVSLVDVVKDAVFDAKQICDSHYGDSPDVTYDILTSPVETSKRIMAFPALADEDELMAMEDILNVNKTTPTGSAASACGQIYGHICPTVHYIIVELMKNAFRATIERHAKRNKVGMLDCSDVPAVKITINARPGLLHSCVCVEDRGTGIRREHLSYAMSYSYTTAKGVIESSNAEQPDEFSADTVPLAGFGYGLPMSRTYARCFGGDVVLNSIEGRGTKVFLYLKSAGSHEESN